MIIVILQFGYLRMKKDYMNPTYKIQYLNESNDWVDSQWKCFWSKESAKMRIKILETIDATSNIASNPGRVYRVAIEEYPNKKRLLFRSLFLLGYLYLKCKIYAQNKNRLDYFLSGFYLKFLKTEMQLNCVQCCCVIDNSPVLVQAFIT